MSVHLVGAGPGDEGLITVKGLRLLRIADVIIYDRLADRSLLRAAKPGARLIFSGKRAGCHSMPQAEINALLIEEGRAAAQNGQVVVRLKGGDPFLFGRGAEELEALQTAGLSCEVVPGVTSALAAPGYAGIPLTHRDFSSSVAIVSGHGAGGNPEPEWAMIANSVDTLVVLMGLGNLAEITRRIMDGGVAPETPAAVVEWGSTGRQRKVIGSLQDIVAKVKGAGIEPPSVLVLGKVAELGGAPSWFEQKPLFGRRIVITRAKEQAAELAGELKDFGADVLEFPVLKIRPVQDRTPLRKLLRNLNKYSWLVFTSANGVIEFFKIIDDEGLDSRHLSALKLAAIGPGTASALFARGLKVDYMPDEHIAESLAEGLAKQAVTNGGAVLPVLVVRAKVARNALENIMEQAGVAVEIAAVYETGLPPEDCLFTQARKEVLAALSENSVDGIVFCSPSAVDNFFKLVPVEGLTGKDAVFACIGPVTADRLKKYGLACTVQPKAYNLEALVNALVDFFTPAVEETK